MSHLRENLNCVRQRIDEAARRSGRTSDAVALVAVTKYVSVDIVRELIAAGCHDLGEARPQELWKKAAALSELAKNQADNQPSVRWHLIGHLQRNKVEQTLPLVSLVHSADSLRLLEAIEASAARLRRSVDVLLEINVSGDETKHGFSPAEVAGLLPRIATLAHVSVRGLMCMAAREGDDTVARQNFAALRKLRDQLQSQRPQNVSLAELSMGMSGDFEIAIEEGATIVRVGSALYEGIGQ